MAERRRTYRKTLKLFFDNIPSFKDFNFKEGDLSSDTVSPDALEPDISPNRLETLKEQSRRLKQDLQTKEEELTLYKGKAVSWMAANVKKPKLPLTTRTDFSDSVKVNEL